MLDDRDTRVEELVGSSRRSRAATRQKVLSSSEDAHIKDMSIFEADEHLHAGLWLRAGGWRSAVPLSATRADLGTPCKHTSNKRANFGRPSDDLCTFEAPSGRPGATSRLKFRTRSEEMDKLKEAHELLQRLRDQHPKDTEEELSRRFAVAVRGDSMMFRAVINNTLGDLLREPQRKRKDN
jgi:hypothetical protein